MNAMLDMLRLSPKKAKIAIIVSGILFTGILAWFVVPRVFSLLVSTILSLWISVRSSTAPFYLFIAVNFIILTIWKLSENRALYTDRFAEQESPFNHDVISLRSRDLVSSENPQFFRKTSLEDLSKTPSMPSGNAVLTDSAGEEASPAPASESSCITTVAEESTASSSSNGLLAPEFALNAIRPKGKVETTVMDERDETDSMDATWNAISRSDRWERSPPPQPTPPPMTTTKRATRVPVTAVPENNAFSGANEEMKRFDDFIKKNYDQIRRRKPG